MNADERKLKLQREAIEGATRRGHDMTVFNVNGFARCRKCDMEAQVIPGYSYEIFGEAVALNCPTYDDLVYDEQVAMEANADNRLGER